MPGLLVVKNDPAFLQVSAGYLERRGPGGMRQGINESPGTAAIGHLLRRRGGDRLDWGDGFASPMWAIQ